MLGFMNDGATTVTTHPLETRDGLRAANAEGLLREALEDLARANARIARMRSAMRAAEIALEARADATMMDRTIARLLRNARTADGGQ